MIDVWRDRFGTAKGLGLAIAAGACLLAAPAHAKPANLKAAAEYYGRFFPAALNNCYTCHLPSTTGKAPTSLADFPHNAFGQRLAALAGELRAVGKRADITSRVRAASAEDSDRDGTSNQDEILAGTNPGSAKERPTPAQLNVVARLRPELTRFLASYRWKPFESVQRPLVPQVKARVPSGRWVRNPIDAFIAAQHEKQGLRPRPEATREVLVRRVYLDLTGLSPTPEERRAFLSDPSPDAYEKLVDRLLASPAYGERWARHWMDVWRYSDWTGYGAQVRDSQPHIWRWRDWIVESLNQDKGYDRMVQEMLAADELAPADPDALRATGFLVRNYKLLSREKWMQDTVDHTAQAFLGLTLGCARCHDHMYDPITQKEYYRFRAIFEPHQVRTDWVPGEFDTKKDGLPRAFDAKPEDPTYLFVRGDERQPVKDEPLAPGVPESLGGTFKVEPVSLPLLARAPERQPFVTEMARAEASKKVEELRRAVQACRTPEETPLAQAKLEAAETSLAALEAVLKAEALEEKGQDSPEWKEAALRAVEAQRREALAGATADKMEASRSVQAAEASKKPAEIKKAQDALSAAATALAKAEKELKEPPSTAYRARGTVYPAASTGRRLALARWLTAPENPLTARVAVNQIWMRHFGRGLLPSVENFGRAGVPPTHPELLDWLAAELMARGWRMKEIHRLIVTSSTYRMASTPDAANLAKDVDNVYLWRMPSRRMDAEIVRDNILQVSGQLDRKLGGPDIDQTLGLSVKRRSLYFRHAQEKEMVFLTTFDGPNVVECYARKETIVPQQALALANSEITLVQSRLLARALDQKLGPDPERFVNAAFEQVLAREPTAAERAECVRFLQHETARFQRAPAPPAAAAPAAPAAPAKAPGKGSGAKAQLVEGAVASTDPAVHARENLVLVLMNHNDFVTIR